MSSSSVLLLAAAAAAAKNPSTKGGREGSKQLYRRMIQRSKSMQQRYYYYNDSSYNDSNNNHNDNNNNNTCHHTTRRYYSSTTSQQYKSSLGIVVQATNMPLSNLVSSSSSSSSFTAAGAALQYSREGSSSSSSPTTTSPALPSSSQRGTTVSSATRINRNNINTNNNIRKRRQSVLAAPTTSSSTSDDDNDDDDDDNGTHHVDEKDMIIKTTKLATSLASSTSSKIPIMESLIKNEEDNKIDMKELQRLSNLTPTPLRLHDMYRYASSSDSNQRLRNAQFLHRELPIRMAQRAYDLLSLPHGLSSESTPIRQVALIYIHYIRQFQSFPMPTNEIEEDEFTELLHSMVLDRTSIPSTIARGLIEWLDDDRREGWDVQRQQEMEDALQRFFTARVGLRFLTEHHILSSPKCSNNNSNNTNKTDELSSNDNTTTTTNNDNNNNNIITSNNIRQSQTQYGDVLSTLKEQDRGCIQHDCNPVLECEKVAREVARQTYDCYNICPEIEIVDRQSTNAQVFTYVPHHLHYMLAELLKNSCRASVERYLELGGDKSPTTKITPVRVVIVKGKNEVTIKVSDQGGGIPRSTMSRIFKFTHSTSRQEYEKDTDFGTVEAGIQHMRGFGLPLARIYARYFGGELTLKSMEGYGLDAYLYLPRLGDACENLPRRVSASPGELVSLPSKKNKKKSSSSSSSSTTTGSGNGKTRTYSTMIPKHIAEATAAKIQKPPPTTTIRNAPTMEPWVMEADESMADDGAWEEDKIRRVLKILNMRAL